MKTNSKKGKKCQTEINAELNLYRCCENVTKFGSAIDFLYSFTERENKELLTSFLQVLE